MNRFQLNQTLAVVRALDIAHNPAPEAIFDPLLQGFNIWCIPQDNPGGDWLKVTKHMLAAAYSKPCEYVACIYAVWDEEVENTIYNRLEDVAWAKKKTAWVFERAGFSCPPIIVEAD